jgi:hypothetical protein
MNAVIAGRSMKAFPVATSAGPGLMTFLKFSRDGNFHHQRGGGAVRPDTFLPRL